MYLDNILVAGDSEEGHARLLDEVLSRFEKAGLRTQRNKCEFMVRQVSCIGHRIDQDELHSLADKVKAITDTPVPRNVRELKWQMGILTYYTKFLPDLSAVLVLWSTVEKDAFRQQRSSCHRQLCWYILIYRPTLPCDASAYGVGAVLSHCWSGSSECPISYASAHC